jgi:hypothetical protein
LALAQVPRADQAVLLDFANGGAVHSGHEKSPAGYRRRPARGAEPHPPRNEPHPAAVSWAKFLPISAPLRARSPLSVAAPMCRKEPPVEHSSRNPIRMPLIAIAVAAVLVPEASSAENLLDFLFGGLRTQQQPTATPAPLPPRPVAAGSGPAFCVRSCDGKYFPLMRGAASPAQLCQAFCPASPTKVFFGSGIDSARTAAGERYAESENAYAYRAALRPDCTCTGRDAVGLAQVDLALDPLRPGDIVATADGAMAYSGIRLGAEQAPDLTPAASYPGLTTEARARLLDMKVAPGR